jgi:hypothetical protein
MRAELNKLLTKLGIDAETIKLLSSDEGEVKVDDIYKSTRDGIAEALKNDDAFITPIKAEVRGQVLSSKERKLMKQFGVSQEEYDALPQQTKFDSLIDLCGQKQKTTGTSEEVKAEIDKLRQKLVEKEDRIKKLVDEEIPAIKSQVELEREANRRQALLQKSLKTAIGDRKLLVSEDAAFAVINSDALSKYDVKIEEGQAVLYKKGTDLKAFDDNNKQLTVEGLFTSTLESHSLVVKSNGNPNPPAPPAPPSGGRERATTIEAPGIARAREAAEARMKKAAEAKQ